MNYKIAEMKFAISALNSNRPADIENYQECFKSIFGEMATVHFICNVYLTSLSRMYYIFEVEVHDKIEHNRKKLVDDRFQTLLEQWRTNYNQYQHDKDHNTDAMDVYSRF